MFITDANKTYREVLKAPVMKGDWIAVERDAALRHACLVQLYRRYVKGHHDENLTDNQRSALEGLLDNKGCDNLAHQVIAVNAGRIQWNRFDVAPPKSLPDAAGTAAAELVKSELTETATKNKFDSVQNQIVMAALRDGNHYVGLSYDTESERVVYIHEEAWDGFCGTWVAYGANGQPAYAVKEWVTAEVPLDYQTADGPVLRFIDTLGENNPPQDEIYRYRNVYLPNRILYFRQAQNGKQAWEPYARLVDSIDADGNASRSLVTSIPWMKNDGTAQGIPVVHFANGNRMSGMYGDSEISGGFVGVQDKVNSNDVDLAITGRLTCFQRTIVTGYMPTDEDGNPVSPTVNTDPGAFTFIPSEGAAVTVIEPGSAAELLSIKKENVQTACRNTDTPMHLITGGDQPSGEAIVRLEAPLVNKARKQIAQFAPSFAELAHRTIELINTRAGKGLNEDALITAEFYEPDRRDALTLATTVMEIAPLLSQKGALRQLGFSAEEIAQNEQEMKDEQETAVTDATANIDQFKVQANANKAESGL